VKIIATGVDLQKYSPVSKKVKESLREKHVFSAEKYLVLHVGHINRNRNAQIMGDIQDIDGVQTIVVGSTSYPEDKDLVKKLEKKGVIVITSYIENIEEIYQSADCYLFPVFSEGASTELPLSVFEAMACNLPVITTKFGGLPKLVKERDDFVYFDTMVHIKPKIKLIRQISSPQTRNLVQRYSWENVIKHVVSDSITR
jgi:glycosyltransferase involved in cell wall biosynthesis